MRVESKVCEVCELSFGHGGDSSGGCTVVRLKCISNLEYHSVYKSLYHQNMCFLSMKLK